MARPTLITLPNEIQDMIYGFCGPEEINIRVSPVTTPTLDGRVEGLMIPTNRDQFTTVRSLLIACKQTRWRILQKRLDHTMAERTTLVMDCRAKPDFMVARLHDKALTKMQLRHALYQKCTKIRFIMPAAFCENHLMTGRFNLDELVGHLILDLKITRDKDGISSWSLEQNIWETVSVTRSGIMHANYQDGVRALQAQIAGFVVPQLHSKDFTGKTLKALQSCLLDPMRKPNLASFDRTRQWRMRDEAFEEYKKAVRMMDQRRRALAKATRG